MPAPTEQLGLMRRGEAFFLESVARLDDDELRGPSLLPGWSRAHILTHIARNADGLCNLLTWARTGAETPMYVGDQRERDIDAGVVRPIAEQRDDAARASARFVAACESMPEDAWDAKVRTRMGREISGATVPWFRIRETWVHSVDLGADAGFGDLPDEVVTPLLAEIAGGLAGREDCPPMNIARTDAERQWRVGPEDDDPPSDVRASGAVLLGWLLGRESIEGAPTAPRWL
jgi:maleylpyruvate isomerase